MLGIEQKSSLKSRKLDTFGKMQCHSPTDYAISIIFQTLQQAESVANSG